MTEQKWHIQNDKSGTDSYSLLNRVEVVSQTTGGEAGRPGDKGGASRQSSCQSAEDGTSTFRTRS